MFHDRERADGSGADAEVCGVEHMRALLPEVLEQATGAFTNPDLAHRISRNFAEAAIPLTLRRWWSLALLVRQFHAPSPLEPARLAERLKGLPGEQRAQMIDAPWGIVLDDGARPPEALRHFEPELRPRSLQ